MVRLQLSCDNDDDDDDDGCDRRWRREGGAATPPRWCRAATAAIQRRRRNLVTDQAAHIKGSVMVVITVRWVRFGASSARFLVRVQHLNRVGSDFVSTRSTPESTRVNRRSTKSTAVKLVKSGQQVSPDSITVQLVSVMVQDWFEWVNWFRFGFRVNASIGQTLVNDSQLSGQRRSTQDPVKF
uniref:Uncharacterized protein n=1 Tax=Helianthus annuus TaxID=4232 RepID=A0A251V1F7_HELAN